MMKKNLFRLRCAVINLREGLLVKDNGHLTEMTQTFFISRQKISSAERTVLVHRKNPKGVPLYRVIERH
jgi:hypothetical protein